MVLLGVTGGVGLTHHRPSLFHYFGFVVWTATRGTPPASGHISATQLTQDNGWVIDIKRLSTNHYAADNIRGLMCVCVGVFAVYVRASIQLLKRRRPVCWPRVKLILTRRQLLLKAVWDRWDRADGIERFRDGVLERLSFRQAFEGHPEDAQLKTQNGMRANDTFEQDESDSSDRNLDHKLTWRN